MEVIDLCDSDDDEFMLQAMEISLAKHRGENQDKKIKEEPIMIEDDSFDKSEDELQRAIQLSLMHDSSLTVMDLLEPEYPTNITNPKVKQKIENSKLNHQKNVLSNFTNPKPTSSPTQPSTITITGPAIPQSNYSNFPFYQNQIPTAPPLANTGTITFSSLLFRDSGREQIQRALLSSLSVDFDWLKKVMPPNVPHSVVRHYSKEDQPGHFMVHDFLTVVHPPLPPSYGCMHCKIFILMFQHHVRIVVTSANLDPQEWTKLDQLIWYEDFVKAKKDSPCEFRDQLIKLVDNWGISGNFLKAYDFTTTKARLITSIPGRHSGNKLNDYGHMRLRTVINSLEQESSKCLLSQSSTVAASSKYWLMEMLASCSTINSKTPSSQNLKIFYPSNEFVQNCLFPEAAGFLHFPNRGATEAIVQNHLYPWTPVRAKRPLVPHLKMLAAINEQNNINWIYIGSHNFTKAAWGKLELKDTQLSISNYEVGVVLPNPHFGIYPRDLPFKYDCQSYAQTKEKPFFVDAFAIN